MTRYRLKHLVSNPVVKEATDGVGRIDLEDITPGDAVLRSNEEERRYRTGEGVVFNETDVLFGKLRPYLRKSLLCDRPGLCSPELLVLRPDRSRIEPRFLHYVVRSAPFLAWAEATSKGVKMPRTDFAALGRYKIELPTIGEQRRISDFLDSVDQNVVIARRKRGLVEKLLGERLDALREEKFAAAGASSRLKWYVTSISQGASPQAEDRVARPGEWAVLKLSAVHRGYFRPLEQKALPVPPDAPTLEPRRGDLLITRSNTPKLVGDCCVVEKSEKRVLLPDLIYRLRLARVGVTPQYVMHFLRSPRGRAQLEAAARGTSQSMVKLRSADVLDIRLPIPTMEQQAVIVGNLDAELQRTTRIGAQLTELEARLRERQQAVISAAIAGEAPSAHPHSAVAIA